MRERATFALRGSLAPLLDALTAPALLPPGFALDDLEVEQGIALLFRGPSRRLTVELDAADPSRGCFARTSRFNLYYRLPGEGGGPLEGDEPLLLERILAAVRAHEAALPVPLRAPPSRKGQIRELAVDRALVSEGPGAYYLNPYVGCTIGCPYCYALHLGDFSRALQGLPSIEWGGWVDVKVNLPAVLRGELARRPPGTVRMSPVITDPYQPLEARYRVTRGCLEALAGTAFPAIVLTRSARVLEDVELLRRCGPGTVGLSVPTDDDEVRAAFDPRAEPIEARLEALAKLREAGLRTFAVIQPMLPQDPVRLAAAIAPHVAAVRIAPLHERERAAPLYARLGREACLDERWERANFEALAAAFAARGVPVNPEGPAWAFLG